MRPCGVRGSVLLLLVGSGLCSCRAGAIAASGRWPAGTPWTTQERVVDGSRLRLIDSGTGPAVVFIHGLAASMFTWRQLLGPVAAAGYRVVAFDNRGFGFSAKPARGYGNSDYVRLLTALLDSLHLDEVVLVGHSMGGQIAAEMALAHPERVRGLVLIGSSGSTLRRSWLTQVAGWPILGRFRVLHGRWATERLLRLTYGDPAKVTAATVDQYYAPLLEPGAVRALHEVMREFRFDAMRERWRGVAAPSLLIWGDRDRIVPLAVGRDVTQLLPRSALVVVPGAGHNVPEEYPEPVLEALLAFLQYGLPQAPHDLAWSRMAAKPGVH